MTRNSIHISRVMQLVVEWYGLNSVGPLPWRSFCGYLQDPYRVWVSEVMLQQTTVRVADAYYRRFMDLFPTVQDLAKASLEDVLVAWKGLGYYRRAHNLHACARVISNEYKGIFPQQIAVLETLPGIGSYTAGAIHAIAWQKPAVAVDTNVLRVLSRVYGIAVQDPARKRYVRDLLSLEVWDVPPGDFYQGVMDIGRVFCKQKAMQCSLCPLSKVCYTAKNSEEDVVVVKTKKRAKSACFFFFYKDNKVYLRKGVPEGNMLKGLYIFPSTPWMDPVRFAEMRVHWPNRLQKESQEIWAKHVFSHFTLNIHVAFSEYGNACVGGEWFSLEEVNDLPLSSLTLKLVRALRERLLWVETFL